MTELQTAEQLQRLAIPAFPTRPSLSLHWRIDPQTGKPIARWVADPAVTPR